MKEAGLLAWAAPLARAQESAPVLIENAEFRLAISSTGIAQSLIHKTSGEECLAAGAAEPMFSVTQYRPYDNELQLSYPARPKTFPAARLRREGDRLIVEFALVGYEATIDLQITDAYIAFTLAKLEYKGYTSLRTKRADPIDESVFLQIPVLDRKYFGEWLNVVWDDAVAVNVLATDPYARVDSIACGKYKLLRAGTVDSVKTEGVGAALIVTRPDHLLDRIAIVEESFGLPRGVESRRAKEYRQSYYELITAKPEEIGKHIAFARTAGLRAMDVYYRIFSKTAGHFDWRPEFPNGLTDVKRMVDRIAGAGIVPGIHIHFNKADKTDAYVTPRPDPRLSVVVNFILKNALDSTSDTITVEENPRQCTLDEARRILKLQDELISYENYTVEPPYRFMGCRRGILGTHASSYPAGAQMGLLDVDTWPMFVRLSQNTDIQQEVAQRLAAIYSGAGFKWVYFDGAEDTPGPDYWYTVGRAQWIVYEKLKPAPMFSEGACKSHFSWHILTRGNAFDVFKPEVMKQAVRAYPAAEAPLVAKDFTAINFGWIGYWAPGPQTIGTQPDMIEYTTSRAAAWDCPISLVGDLPQLEAHPRTPDNLAVVARWEDVRAKNWLSSAQKLALRNLDQEHTLLVNEEGGYELVPYDEIERAGGANSPVRAFIFERRAKVYVVFWHTSGSGTLEVPIDGRAVRLMQELSKPISVHAGGTSVRLPLANRMYLECAGLSRETVISAFRKATVIAK